MEPVRLGVGIVGAGKVGAVLGAALRAAGHAVIAATARSEESRDRVRDLLPGVPVADLATVVDRSELVLLAVPDDQLEPLIGSLSGARAWHEGQIVVHTSGRYGAKILEPAASQGALTVAIHPAMTFTGTELDLSRLTDTVFGVSGELEVLPIAQALAVEMGGEPVVIAEADRPIYHAALAHGSNHLVTLVGQSASLLRSIGVSDPARMLGPLLRSTLDNALSTGESALTGPVARGDVRTVREHVRALDALAARGEATDVPESYRHLSGATIDRALRRGKLSPEVATSLREALKRDEN